MAKKANGEGNLRQLPNGVWECVINYNDMECLQTNEEELYEMYLKLHEKFGGMQL